MRRIVSLALAVTGCLAEIQMRDGTVRRGQIAGLVVCPATAPAAEVEEEEEESEDAPPGPAVDAERPGVPAGAAIATAPHATYAAGITHRKLGCILLQDGARIPETEVSDVDHPGSVLTVIGSILLASGAMVVGLAQEGQSTQDRDKRREEGIALLIPGGALAALGMLVWGRSVDRADKFVQPDR